MYARISNMIGDKKLTIFLGLSFIAILVGIIHASSLSFVNDDAFISFRYAKNLVDGFGLVYNAGERVEGYTNFLWTIFIALGMKLHIDPVPFSATLGLIFYTCTLLLFIFSSWKHKDINSKYFFFIPLTALALSVHRDFNVYATSGLETSMFTFLVSLGFVLLLHSKKLMSLFCAGIICVFMMMTRPDGAIFTAASIIYLILTRQRRIKEIFYFLLPSIIIFIPYWFWRYDYYGFFFPNTFYAKSIALPYYTQGLKYTLLYFGTYYSPSLLIPLIGIALYQRLPEIKLTGIRNSFYKLRTTDSFKPILLASLFIGFYTLFIIRIGGDFMHARFFIPITPILFFIIEYFIVKVTTRNWNLILITLVLFSTIFRNDMFGNKLNVGYIVDEVKFYTQQYHQSEKANGEKLRHYFEGLPVRVAFWGSKLRLIYYADPVYALEANAGLTDTALAHQTLSMRGRPGHEKNAPLSFLIDRKINFFFTPMYEQSPDKSEMNRINFDSVGGYIIGYYNPIMSALEKYPEIKFIHIPDYIDSYLTNIKLRSQHQVEQDYIYFRSYYFIHNSDSVRDKEMLSYLKEGNPSGNNR
jgi:hypothetical protein